MRKALCLIFLEAVQSPPLHPKTLDKLVPITNWECYLALRNIYKGCVAQKFCKLKVNINVLVKILSVRIGVSLECWQEMERCKCRSLLMFWLGIQTISVPFINFKIPSRFNKRNEPTNLSVVHHCRWHLPYFRWFSNPILETFYSYLSIQVWSLSSISSKEVIWWPAKSCCIRQNIQVSEGAMSREYCRSCKTSFLNNFEKFYYSAAGKHHFHAED